MDSVSLQFATITHVVYVCAVIDIQKYQHNICT